MTHIFISYNREDQFRARMIADGLKAEGLHVWWDTNLRAGESYDEVTEKHLREAGAVVVLWSKKSVNSKWVRAEATVGERFSKLVPAMIEPCERPLRFELVQTADLVNWQGDRSDPNWRLFIQGVKNAVGHHEEAPPAPAAAPGGSADSSNDITIENTFWTSIKDGSETADFEAYLKRYPQGHFADLARNRLASLQRKAEAKRHAPPQQQTSRPAPSSAPRRPAASAPPAKPRAAPPPPPEKKGGAGAMIALAALAAALVGGGVFAAMQFMGGDTAARQEIVAAAPAEKQPVEEQAQEEIINAADTSIETTDMLDPAAQGASEGEAVAENASPLGGAAAEGEAELAALAEGAEAPAETAAVVEEPAPVAAITPSSFSDCENCPVMKVLPGGAFMMGSAEDEPGHVAYEGPKHEVTVSTVAISETEVTHAQWQACVDDGGCGAYTPGDAGFGRDNRPAIYISWRDAQSYVKWLSAKTGKSYRLPTEAEWEYAARGGTQSAYWWGDRFDRNMVSFGTTRPVDELTPNPFGLRGMLGNAAEWVQDCYINNFGETPVDGSAMTGGDCGRRVIRGGSWRDKSSTVRSANRGRITQTVRDGSMGFRVALSVD